MNAGWKVRFQSALLAFGVLAAFPVLHRAHSQEPSEKPKERAHVLLSKEVPPLGSENLKVTLVEVNYGPDEASSPHSHPCAVIGYIASGAIRTQVQGQPEETYKAGETFYEAPNGVHLVSANASRTEPAKLLAYLVCDRNALLSVDVQETTPKKGSAQ